MGCVGLLIHQSMGGRHAKLSMQNVLSSLVFSASTYPSKLSLYFLYLAHQLAPTVPHVDVQTPYDKPIVRKTCLTVYSSKPQSLPSSDNSRGFVISYEHRQERKHHELDPHPTSLCTGLLTHQLLKALLHPYS